MKNLDMTVSVAMAAYNGEKYIAEQIKSILSQLKESDELVISINPSSDRTEYIVKEYAKKDNRIKIFICEKRGVLPNFENAIRQCKNNIIFLSDQDDIWVEDKIVQQLKYFEDDSVGGVCHGCKYIDENDELMKNQPKPRRTRKIKFFYLLIKNQVQGCTLAFRRKMIGYFLPFPKHIPMHDSWIGMCLSRKSKLLYINKPLLLYRQHDGTVTERKHGSLISMIKDRIKLAYAFLKSL